MDQCSQKTYFPFPIATFPDVTEKRDCSTGARKCGVVAKQVFDKINKAATSSLLQSMEENLSWTHAPEVRDHLSSPNLRTRPGTNTDLYFQVFTECVREMRTDSPLRVLTSLLIGSAALERSLGDVSLSVSWMEPLYIQYGLHAIFCRYTSLYPKVTQQHTSINLCESVANGDHWCIVLF